LVFKIKIFTFLIFKRFKKKLKKKVKKKIKKRLEENPNIIIPKERYNETIIKLKKDKIEDISVSRTIERVKWGIEVPNDNTQLIYVWLDALSNYLTNSNYFNSEDNEFDTIWPPELQVFYSFIII
jgi:methionyl-tRNA synthetase